MTALPCSHGMPNAATCMDCMEEGPVSPPSSWVRVGDSFRARYCGGCTCAAGIHEGDRVQRWDNERDDLTAYVHEGCRP